jgi:hypothetical protein
MAARLAPGARHQFVHGGRLIYEWDQTLAEVNMYVPVPPDLRAKEIFCEVTKQHLRFGRHDNPPFLDVSAGWRRVGVLAGASNGAVAASTHASGGCALCSKRAAAEPHATVRRELVAGGMAHTQHTRAPCLAVTCTRRRWTCVARSRCRTASGRWVRGWLWRAGHAGHAPHMPPAWHGARVTLQLLCCRCLHCRRGQRDARHAHQAAAGAERHGGRPSARSGAPVACVCVCMRPALTCRGTPAAAATGRDVAGGAQGP